MEIIGLLWSIFYSFGKHKNKTALFRAPQGMIGSFYCFSDVDQNPGGRRYPTAGRDHDDQWKPDLT